MNKLFKMFLLLATVSVVSFSCSDNNKNENKTEAQQEEEFRHSLSQSDSLRVVSLGDSVMSLFRERKLEEAISCISQLDSLGNIQSLDISRKAQLVRQFQFFPVNDFKLVDYIFNTAEQNIITYKISFDENSVDKSTSTTNFALSPVKVQNQWFLTIRQTALPDGHDNKPATVQPDSVD